MGFNGRIRVALMFCWTKMVRDVDVEVQDPESHRMSCWRCCFEELCGIRIRTSVCTKAIEGDRYLYAFEQAGRTRSLQVKEEQKKKTRKVPIPKTPTPFRFVVVTISQSIQTRSQPVGPSIDLSNRSVNPINPIHQSNHSLNQPIKPQRAPQPEQPFS
jgi:hypothetical protein